MIIEAMVIDMDEAQVRTLEQVRQIVAGTQALEFRRPQDDEGRYGWIEQVLRRFGYRQLTRADKGAVLELERTVELAPDMTEAHYHLGAARQRLGDRRGAENEYRWVLLYSEDPYYRTAARGGLLALRRAA